MAAPVGGLAAFAVLPFDGAIWPITAMLGLVASIAALPLTARQVNRISSSEHPMVEALAAVTTVATVVLVGFAASYYALARHTGEFSGLETKVDALYFTIVTLGTVGYGDIVAVGQWARALVATQILLNLTVVGLSIRWISKATAERRQAVGET